jgi:hypothetical protein
MEDVVIWRPTHDTCVELPVVIGDLASATTDRPVTLQIEGLGECEDSGQDSVYLWEEGLGRPAVAARLSYACMPVTAANLTRIAVEVPQILADYFGQGKPVHLVTNSLGCLTVNGAAEAPELFDSVASMAPYALSSESYARLPLIGSLPLLRPLALTGRLGIQTPWQLRHKWRDPRLYRVAKNTVGEIKALGRYCNTAVGHALSNEIARRTADSYLTLADVHAEHLLTTQDDKVAKPPEVRRALLAAAARKHVDPTIVDQLLEVVPGVHYPWCISEGLEALKVLGHWQIELVA